MRQNTGEVDLLTGTHGHLLSYDIEHSSLNGEPSSATRSLANQSEPPSAPRQPDRHQTGQASVVAASPHSGDDTHDLIDDALYQLGLLQRTQVASEYAQVVLLATTDRTCSRLPTAPEFRRGRCSAVLTAPGHLAAAGR